MLEKREKEAAENKLPGCATSFKCNCFLKKTNKHLLRSWDEQGEERRGEEKRKK
jgi:hypothetical protein